MTPQPGVNYNVICFIQTLGVVVCCICLFTQYVLDIEQTKGWFIIFAPFIPTLFWQLQVRKRWHLAKPTKDKHV